MSLGSSEIIFLDVSNMTSLYLLEVAERLAPIVESWENPSGESAFAAITRTVTASDNVTGTAAF